MRNEIAGIGRLIDLGQSCRLVWEQCGHTIELAKFDDIERWIRRHYASCIECARACTTLSDSGRRWQRE